MKKIFFITSLFVGSIYASNGGLENLIEKLEEHKRSFEESRDKNARLIVKGAKKLKKATCDFEKGFITEADFRKIESETLPVLDMCMRFYNEDDAKVKSYVADIAEQKARLRSKQSEQSFQKKIEIYLRNTLSEDCEGGENVRECVIECIKLTCYNMKISYDKIMKLMNCFKDMCAKYTGETQYYISDTVQGVFRLIRSFNSYSAEGYCFCVGFLR